VKVESAHRASNNTGDSSNRCLGGKHNPKARNKKERCYELYPHIKEEDEAKKREKSK
jgi:hypothetical protein